ncbi:MAG: gamma-glutamylcyclotransferase [Thermoanaerobaculia bacterium]|nr:gamma-glutamylcyclotransferase [Thermoanaerobaculia bacterium]
MNRARASGGWSEEAREAEREIEREHGASRRLAAYGTLQPGAPNHHLVADLGGSWLQGRVRGRLRHEGWGVLHGYPALEVDPRADEVSVVVLVSDRLPAAWKRLDRFEGPGYLRVLVPVVLADGAVRVANLYAARGPGAHAL